MRMSVDEPGKHGLAAQIDDLCRGTRERSDLVHLADGQEAAVPYRHRLGNTKVRICGDEFAVDVDGTGVVMKWPRAAGPFLAAVKLESRLLVVLYQAAKGSVCC